jgi:hypothetical protein
MKIVRITINDNGVVTNGRENLRDMILTAKSGEYIMHLEPLSDPHTEDDWRKLYFYLRDILHQSVETGYTKNELHTAIKTKIIVQMWENPHHDGWFVMEPTQISTQFLTATGWREFVKRFKELSIEMYEFYI